jgi:hypothetical protein
VEPANENQPPAQTTTTSASMGPISSIIPATISVLVVATAVAVMVLQAPMITLSNWVITHQSIAVSFEGEAIDNPYTITLMHDQEIMASYEILDTSYEVNYDGLTPETAYDLMIEADYGAGAQRLKTFHIVTAGAPSYQKARVRISAHEVDYATRSMKIYLFVDDPGDYLSNYVLTVSDGIHNIEYNEFVGLDVLIIPLESFARGYLTIELFAESSYPTDHQGLLKLINYKVYY